MDLDLTLGMDVGCEHAIFIPWIWIWMWDLDVDLRPSLWNSLCLVPWILP